MSSSKPVSIFIITYLTSEERGEVLRRTCESALAQNYPEFEVVVSENPGPVHASEALASITDPRLKVVRGEENTGFSGNINRCAELCSYDIIKLLCDDDLIHPDFLAQTVPYVDDQTLIMTDIMKFRIGTDPEAMSQPTPASMETELREAGYGLDIWTLSYSYLPSAMLFTRALFNDLGGFDPKTITGDWDFFIETCIHKNVVHVMQQLCYVGVWSGSLTEEMAEKPYFFPIEGLYTRLRVYHSKALPEADRRKLRSLLFRELGFQCLRPVRHLSKPHYWAGCAAYVRRFFKLFKPDDSAFTARPNQ